MAKGSRNARESSDNDDIISILLATDCHLGFMEKDPIRGQDSFVTFEEVLQHAVEKEVDFILLGGDLFHDNKPSRNTLHQTMYLIRKYCMGNRPCKIEFLSDQSINFSHCKIPVVNYEDPNLNVSYPVFSVHGNHDDPTGEGSLSAIDLLSVSGLINHFGKTQSVDEINISPVLLQKGATKLALFGLGSVRDERLHKTFCNNKVRMLRPKDDPDSWFNIFVIHQNRAKHGATNYIPENFLDEFLDLVVWGHEHECLIDAEWSVSGKAFFVTQPGSTVATSLSPGEARPKHVGLLQIHKKDFKLDKIPLKTVRPFLIEDITLSDTSLDPSSDERVSSYLTHKVESMIEKVPNAEENLPLVRLKVEYSGGFASLNPSRFGQAFVNRVANPKDILLFYRKRAQFTRGDKTNKGMDNKDFAIDHANTVRMEDVINQILNSTDQSLQLQVLSERRLGKALREFVDKEEKDAIRDLVKWELGNVQNELVLRNAKEESVIEELQNVKLEKEAVLDDQKENEEIRKVLASSRTNQEENADLLDSNQSDEEMDCVPRGTSRGRRGARGTAAARGNGPSRGTASTRGSTRGRGSRGTAKAKATSSRGRGSRGGASKNSLVTDSFISVTKPSQKRTKTEPIDFDSDNDADYDGTNISTVSRGSRRTGVVYEESIPESSSDEHSDPFDIPASSRKRPRR